MAKPDHSHTAEPRKRKGAPRSVQDQVHDAVARAKIAPDDVIAAIREATGAAIDPAHDLDMREIRQIIFRLGLLLIDRDRWKRLHADRDRWERLHADRQTIHKHAKALLVLLPRAIREAEGLTGAEAYDARALLAALEPLARIAWPDKRAWWHPHAANLLLPLFVLLTRHNRRVGWSNATAPAVQTIERLIALCGEEVKADAIVAALRRGTDKLFSSCQ